MKILVVGSKGQVGVHLMRTPVLVPGIDVHGADTTGDTLAGAYLNLLNPWTVENVFEEIKPDVVIHCSALTDVDDCEKNKHLAKEINVGGVKLVAGLCKKYKSRLVFFSTDYVFDGKTGPYTEKDKPNPINYYGKTKLEGEKIVSKLSGSLIIRTCMVYSYLPYSLNYGMQVFNRLRNGEEVRAYADQHSNPTYAPDLAKAVMALVMDNAKGLYHVAGSSYINKLGFAELMRQVCRYNIANIMGITTKKEPNKAPRPLKAGLKSYQFHDKYSIEDYEMSDCYGGIQKMLRG